MQSANFELTPSWDDPAVLVTTGLSPRRIWGYVHRNGEWFLIGDESLRPGQMHRAESFEAAQAAALNAAEAQLAYERANARLIAAATGTEPDYSDLGDPGEIATHEENLAALAAERDA
jgi:hypothetical protein